MTRPTVVANTPPLSTNRILVLRVLNVLFLLAMLAFNYIANAAPLNGKTTGMLSDQYPNLFTPIGLTFSIWGVIYLSLTFFAVWQAWPLRSIPRAARRDVAVNALGFGFVGLCLLNMLWLFCWHYEYLTASVVVMLCMLSLLIGMNQTIFSRLPHTMDDRNFLQIPFGLYLGWISVATVANITVYLIAQRWEGWGLSERFWTIAMMLVAVLLALVAVLNWRNIPYGLAVAWALLGISLKHQAMFDIPLSAVILTAYLGMLILLIAIGARLRRWWDTALNNDVYHVPQRIY